MGPETRGRVGASMLRTEKHLRKGKDRVRAKGEWGAVCGWSVAARQKWREMLLVTQAKGHVVPGLGACRGQAGGAGERPTC